MLSLQPRLLLATLLITFALVAAAFSAIIPLGEAADEVSHHSYVRYVAEYGGMPPVIAGTTVFGETFQPPLYYALAAPLTAWLPRGDNANLGFDIPVENNADWELGNPKRARLLLQPAEARWTWQGEALGWHLVRLFSVLIGVGTVFFTYRLGGVVWGKASGGAWLAALFVACLPSFIGVSAAVTNDSLATLIGAILLWQLARNITTPIGDQWQSWAFIGVLGAAGVWTKAGGWLFVVTTTLAVALWIWNGLPGGLASIRTQSHAIRAKVQSLFVTGGVWLVGVLPLLWINYQRSGDLLGQGVQSLVTDARTSLTLADFGAAVASLHRTWWAGFGGAVHLSFPEVVNISLTVLLLGVAGVGLGLRHLQRATAPRHTQLLIPLLAAHVGLLGIAWFGWTQMVLGTGQGRLLFPALPALAVLLGGGWTAFFPQTPTRARIISAAYAIALPAMVILSLVSILLPAYRTPHTPEPLPAEAATGRWQVGDLPLALTAFYAPYTVDSRLKAGERTTLYLAWESSAALPDVRLRLRWIDRDGNNVGAPKEGSLIAAHPLTDEWQAGQYAATHVIPLPDGIEGGYYRLMLGVVDAADGTVRPLVSADGGTSDEIMVGQTTVVE